MTTGAKDAEGKSAAVTALASAIEEQLRQAQSTHQDAEALSVGSCIWSFSHREHALS